MTRRKVILIVVVFILPLCLLMAGVRADDAASPATPANADDKAAAELQDRIAKLIVELGSNDFNEREAAQEALIEIGIDAHDAVQAALKDDDPEIVQRAGQILEALKLQKVQITFLIIDENGKPLANKAVKVSKAHYTIKEEWTLLKEGTTDADGILSMPPIPDTTAKFKLEIQGYPTITTNGLEYQPGKHTIPLNILPGGNVKGHVLDRDGAPVKGVEIKIADVTAITDETGSYELKNIPCGWRNVDIMRPSGYEYGREIYIKPGVTWELTIEASKVIRLEDYDVMPEAENRPQQSAGVKCTLVQPNGQPITGFLLISIVDLDDKHSRPYERDADLADKNGVTPLHLSNSHNYEITLFAAGFKPLSLGQHKFALGETWEIKEPLKFEEGITAQVMVTDAGGKPISGAKVIAQSVNRGGRISYHDGVWGDSTTDGTGLAKVAGLEATQTVFKAYCEGYLVSDEKAVALKENGNEVIKITLQKPGSAKITLIDAETNKPIDVKNQSIRAWYDNAEARERSGSTLIRYEGPGSRGPSGTDSVAPGRRYIIGKADGYWPGYFVGDFKSGETTEGTIVLKKRVAPSLNAKIEFTKEVPFSEFGYMIVDRRPFEWGHGGGDLIVRVSPDGSFAMPDISEGYYYAWVYDKKDNIVGRSYFSLDMGEAMDLVIQLHRQTAEPDAGPLDVSVEDEKGNPMVGCEVSLQIQDDDKHSVLSGGSRIIERYADNTRWEITGADGKCRFANLPHGKGEVRIDEVVAGSRLGAIADVDVVTGKAASIELKLRKNVPMTGVIEGRIISPPNRNCSIYCSPYKDKDDRIFYCVYDQYPNGVWPNTDGSFAIPNLAAGRYSVRVAVPGRVAIMPAAIRVEVKEGEHVKGVEIRFPDKLQKFSGKCAGSRFLENEEILRLAGDYNCEVTVRPDGTFEGLVPAGKYQVTRYYDDQSMSKPVEIVIEDGKDLENIEIP